MAITNYGEVITAKIRTCRSNFRSGGINPWRSSDFDPCRSNGIDRSCGGVELRSEGDRSVGWQSEEGRQVERIMKGSKVVRLVNFVTQRTVPNRTNQKL